MSNYLSSIGFDVETQEDFAGLVEGLAAEGRVVPARSGQYRLWAGDSGEELWIQVWRRRIVGVSPHFSGKSRCRVGLVSRVERPGDTALDGSFRAWADPNPTTPGGGEYPFVFDVPDAGAYRDLALPGVAEAQITAFAHGLSYHESTEAYDDSQSGDGARFATKSFIPAGLFSADGTRTDPPEAGAIFTGIVVESRVCTNARSGGEFQWMLVDTLGGTYDVVAGRSLVDFAPAAGGVVSVSAWMSGRLTSYAKQERPWYRRFFGGAD